MKINELKANSKVSYVKGLIVTIDEPKEYNGTKLQEMNIKDETGEIKLTVWAEFVGLFSVGEEIVVTEGWCKSFKEQLQITTGKFGKIEKVKKEC